MDNTDLPQRMAQAKINSNKVTFLTVEVAGSRAQPKPATPSPILKKVKEKNTHFSMDEIVFEGYRLNRLVCGLSGVPMS